MPRRICWKNRFFWQGVFWNLTPNSVAGQGYHVAKEILASGRALEAINKIIYAQGKAAQPQLGHLTRDIVPIRQVL